MNLQVIEFNLEKKSDIKIKKALLDFVNRDSAYKNKFLQAQYNLAFDGYSYIGQKDSLNQYDTDMLHSFVLSDFQSIENFPKEFHEFFSGEWDDLIATVKTIEQGMLKQLNNPVLNELYEDDKIGYMMSCNYYPKPNNCETIAKNNTRLSAHKDVSLFSTFPYGLAKGLSYRDTNKKSIELEGQENVILFPGYFMEFATNNEIAALNHQVNLPLDMDSERFSFAVFSIPKPNACFQIGNKTITSDEYYQNYLSLF